MCIWTGISVGDRQAYRQRVTERAVYGEGKEQYTREGRARREHGMYRVHRWKELFCKGAYWQQRQAQRRF